MAFDEVGQADNYERKSKFQKVLWYFGESSWFPSEDVIFDLNIFPVATGMDEHQEKRHDFIETTRWVRTNLQKYP